jgi:protein phosphatase methylesterase 1
VPVIAGVLTVAAALVACTAARPLPAPVSIRDDARLQAAVEEARARFLPAGRLDRLDVTVLLAAPDGSWLRGSVGGRTPWYPASCVKLAFAVAAVHWCETRGRAADCLDEHVAPMLRDSDNVATGHVVDAVTGAPNGPVEGADFETWSARRLYTERLLEQHGLLDGQRLFNKTYPTNSGEVPAGLEALGRERLGRNLMHPDGAALLMVSVVDGRFGRPAADYLRSRLRRPQVSYNSAMGGGLPERTLFESKVGEAYDVIAEIAYAELPDGRRIVIAAFSNGRNPEGADEQDVTVLAPFARLLVERLPVAHD